MNRCRDWNQQLVDYADGELEEQQATQLKQHLQDCEACRTRLASLTRSLSLAQQVWSQPTSAPKQLGAWPDPRIVVVATLAILAVVLGWNGIPFDRFAERQPERIASPTPGLTSIAERRSSDTSASDPAAKQSVEQDPLDLDALMANETRAARLAASAEQLADHPSLADYSRRADEYLITHYADSSSAQAVNHRNSE